MVAVEVVLLTQAQLAHLAVQVVVVLMEVLAAQEFLGKAMLVAMGSTDLWLIPLVAAAAEQERLV